MADVKLGAFKRHDLRGAAELGIHAALSGEDVDQAVVAPGAGAALGRPAGVGDVHAWVFLLQQRTEVTQQGVLAESRKDQSSQGQQA